MSPAHSHEDNVIARGGKDEPLIAGRDAGRREEEVGDVGGGGARATPSIFGFGSCSRPPIDVYLFMMQ